MRLAFQEEREKEKEKWYILELLGRRSGNKAKYTRFPWFLGSHKYYFTPEA